MKKAYIIMAHKNPKQVQRLVSRLNDGESAFFIHIDRKVDIRPFQILEEFGDRVSFLERVNSKWGGFGSIQATFNGLKAIRNSPQNFERIFLLSGQDYPIKSNEYINEFLKNSNKSVFVEFDRLPDHQKWPGKDRGGMYRVDKYYLGIKWYNLPAAKAMNFLATCIPYFRRVIPHGMKPFVGSAWWSIDLYTLHYILDHDARHPEYRKFHRFTFVPDEVYFNMIIGNAKDEKILNSLQNNNKRLIVWEKWSNPHPKLFTVDDFKEILASDQLFARKFDETVDEGVLNLIDHQILYKDRAEVDGATLPGR